MKPAIEERVERLLCDLITLRTVNPMGQHYRDTLPVERPVVEYLERLFARYDAMVMAALDLLETGESPPQPVWLLAAGDEEHAQSGIRYFLNTEQHPIGRAVFGEPTELAPVVQHQGTIRWDITLHGRAAHTSRPELGQSAILEAIKVIEALNEHQRQLRAVPTRTLTNGPSVTVTMIEGGRTRNMVPDQCKIAVDFRTPPELDARQAVAELFARIEQLGVSLRHSRCAASRSN